MVIIGNVSDTLEGLILKVDNVKMKIGLQTLSTGTLYINECCLAWKPEDREVGISITWPEIGVQAISNTTSRCIYIMLDSVVMWSGVYDPGARQNGNNRLMEDSDEDEGNESDCGEEVTEIWLIPSDPNIVEQMYEAMKSCQGLNPEPNDSISEDEGEYMGMDDEDEHINIDESDEIGQDNMRNLSLDEDRFQDAEEE